MNKEDFNNKMGNLVKAPKAIYETFEPKRLPIDIKYDEEFIKVLGDAILSLGNLSGMGHRMKNPHLLITPYLKKEAVLSSKMEGTRTSLSEVFLHEKERKKKEDEDLEEVNNYVKALEYGLREIKDNPITESLIKKMHAILMKGVRGENKEPGRYKSHQNWIGSSDDILEARFVPASPETTPKLMSNLLSYLNDYKKITELIKMGIIHYQFETIHPFRDGNGRLGRLLVILYLCKVNTLSQPLLYLSAYLEKNRERYNDLLLNVSTKGETNEWLKFFLKGVKIQSDDALDRAIKLENYYEKCRELLQKKSQSPKVLTVLDHLFVNPYITIPETKKILSSYYSTAKNNINILMENKILIEIPKSHIKGKKPKEKIFYAPRIGEILLN